MDIIDRMQMVIDREGLSISAFAKRIGAIDQTVRGIVVQRRNKPSYEVLAKIIQTFPWLNAEWLLTGNGEMVKSESLSADSGQMSMAELVSYLREKDAKIERLIEEKTELRIKYEMSQERIASRERSGV